MRDYIPFYYPPPAQAGEWDALDGTKQSDLLYNWIVESRETQAQAWRLSELGHARLQHGFANATFDGFGHQEELDQLEI